MAQFCGRSSATITNSAKELPREVQNMIGRNAVIAQAAVADERNTLELDELLVGFDSRAAADLLVHGGDERLARHVKREPRPDTHKDLVAVVGLDLRR
jgi:hypothetical protein